jgi:hypothetical protein
LLLGLFALLAFPNTFAEVYPLLKLVMHIKEVFSRYWAQTLQENMQQAWGFAMFEHTDMPTRSYNCFDTFQIVLM